MNPQTQQAGSSVTAIDGTPLNPLAVNLAKAIRQTESGGDYNAVGDNGESHGAYQFNKNNFKDWASQYGLDPNDTSPVNQDKVAYARISDLLKQGRAPSEVAAIWNGANFVNGKYEAINPSYVDKVKQNYAKVVGGDIQPAPQSNLVSDQTQTQTQDNTQTQTPQDTTQSSSEGGFPVTPLNTVQQTQTPPPPPQQTPYQGVSSLIDDINPIPNLTDIGTELAGNIATRFQQGGHGLSDIASGGPSGNLGLLGSGALQTVGAIAGGAGDVLNAGLELVPGVQRAEKDLSKGIGAAAQLPQAQPLIQGLQSFVQQHPEAAGDIGAAVNIASVIPMFKGLGLIKGAVQDATLAPFKSALTDAAGNEMRNSLTSTAANTLASAEKRGLDPIGYLTSNPETLPSIGQNAAGSFVYDSSKAAQAVNTSLSQDENTLQKMLSQATGKNMVNINAARQQTLKDIVSNIDKLQLRAKALRAANSAFDDMEEGEAAGAGRSYISINELNDLKRTIGGDINWNTFGSNAGTVKRALYSSVQNQVEKYATKAGISGVKELNQTMGEKLEALNVLQKMNGRGVRQSAIGKILREVGADIAGAGGEAVGAQAGVPYAGTLAGRGLSRLLPGRVPLTPLRLLGRGGRGTVASSVGRGLLGAGIPQAARSIVNPQQSQ